MEGLFFILVLLLIYPYILYPLAVFMLSRFLGRGWKKSNLEIPITIIISAYNEERIIRQKILNTLSLQYPESLIEIIISSDGSNDSTNQIVSSFSDRRLKLRAFHKRSGKTACLNKVVPEVKGEIILFTDANSIFPSDMLQKLVRSFADSTIGLVTGWTKYRKSDGEEESTGIYSRIERFTKYSESLISSCVGADGAIFAIRKNLYKPLREDDINDFVIPLHVISQGKRVILDPEVYCYEQPSKGDKEEFRRQARITSRTLNAIFRNPRFLNPISYGFFSFFLISHKVLKFMVPFFFIGSFILSANLSFHSLGYLAIFSGHILFIGLAFWGMMGWLDLRLVNLCKLFALTSAGQIVGWGKAITRKPDVMWTPQR